MKLMERVGRLLWERSEGERDGRPADECALADRMRCVGLTECVGSKDWRSSGWFVFRAVHLCNTTIGINIAFPAFDRVASDRLRFCILSISRLHT